MAWIIVAAALALIGGFLIFTAGPVKIPREYEREGEQDVEASRAYDRMSQWFIFRLERRIILRALGKMKPQGRLVDIGSGPGYLAAEISRAYPSLTVTGLDNNSEMMKLALRNFPPERHNVQFTAGDAHNLPFPDNSVDFAVISLSMHHWEDAGAVLREINRVLKPGGRMFILDIRRDTSWLFFYGVMLSQVMSPRDIRRVNGAVGSYWASYTIPELKEMLSQVPFSEARVERHFGWVQIYGTKK
jgi:ubiquinone/menaquinone biosynthesis C-methylase UbiE